MIELQQVSKYYHANNTVTMGLSKISLTFNLGEFVAITGESGSGKTTLLNVISGLDSYEEGEILFEGQPTSHYDNHDWEQFRKHKIAFIFQNYNLIDSYSAIENVKTVLYLQGYGSKEAELRAATLLKKVGLYDRRHHRAAQLSSGQKQRLAIARALAKDTDILVADEPTGNLDSENGREILEILSRLSRQKLVLLVTHNYEEAAPYVTRKIRLFEGEVVEDDLVFSKVDDLEEDDPMGVEDEHDEVDTHANEPKSSLWTAFRFAFLNIISQPRRVALLWTFFLLTSLSSFVLLGNIYANANDDATKIFNTEAFSNPDQTRLVVRRQDDQIITAEDDEQILALSSRIDRVSHYGFIDDINYFSEENEDFHYVYTFPSPDPTTGEVTGTPTITPFFDQFDKYVADASSLNIEYLRLGTMPESFNEVVIQSNDASLLDTTKMIYLKNDRLWGANGYVGLECKIVGLLNDKCRVSLAFSTAVAQVLSSNSVTEVTKGGRLSYRSESGQSLTSNFVPIVFVDPHLSDNQMQLSTYYMDRIPEDNRGSATFSLTFNNEPSLSMQVMTTPHQSGSNIIMVSEAFYEEHFPSEGKVTYQSAVYLTHPRYTRSVIRTLAEHGYDALSVYEVSTIEYDMDLVTARLITLGISGVSLFVIYLLEIVICRSLLKFKKNDFIILRSLGMESKTVKTTNYIELAIYAVSAMIITAVLVTVLSTFIPYLHHLWIYYGFGQWLLFALVNLLGAFLLATFFNRYLQKRIRVSALKEE